MIRYLFEFDDWFVAGVIIAFFAVTAALLAAFGLRPAFQSRAKAVAFATPDLLIFLGVLFGLNIGFLGAEIEDRIQKAASAISAEGNAFRSIASTLRLPHVGAHEVMATALPSSLRVPPRRWRRSSQRQPRSLKPGRAANPCEA